MHFTIITDKGKNQEYQNAKLKIKNISTYCALLGRLFDWTSTTWESGNGETLLEFSSAPLT